MNIHKKYKNNLLSLWVQEEPENMGAWRHISNEMKDIRPEPVTRMASGSPATGLFRLHQIGQEEIIDKVFRKCDCELQNKYCGLQCVVGKSRREILKQHQYFDKG
jgi:2-oxoglutarate dehydrogenase E1 component